MGRKSNAQLSKEQLSDIKRKWKSDYPMPTQRDLDICKLIIPYVQDGYILWGKEQGLDYTKDPALLPERLIKKNTKEYRRLWLMTLGFIRGLKDHNITYYTTNKESINEEVRQDKRCTNLEVQVHKLNEKYSEQLKLVRQKNCEIARLSKQVKEVDPDTVNKQANEIKELNQIVDDLKDELEAKDHVINSMQNELAGLNQQAKELFEAPDQQDNINLNFDIRGTRAARALIKFLGGE